jgi:hypothetical protein
MATWRSRQGTYRMSWWGLTCAAQWRPQSLPRGPRTRLICLAFLGTLVISCGDSGLRAGGAPPGAPDVIVPGGDDSPLDRWLKNLDVACGKAVPEQPPRCLELDIRYYDSEYNEILRQHDQYCRIKEQAPEKGTRVSAGTQVRLRVVCDTSSTGTDSETQGN